MTDTPTPNVAALARILAKVLEFNSYDFATPRAMRAVCEELAAAGVLAVEALTDEQCEAIGEGTDDYGVDDNNIEFIEHYPPKGYQVRDALLRLARGETP